MSESPTFDLGTAHRHFSIDCFNKVWTLLDKPNRTEAENQQMILLSLASIWHWTRREDCTDTNLSVGWWQASRVHASTGFPDEAKRYGNHCLEISKGKGIEPFYLGYAYEALARAESLAGNRDAMSAHLAAARKAAEQITDEEMKKLLLSDLETIQ